jgi:hypothetical protein
MKWFALIGLLVFSTQAYAECAASSGEKRTSLLELYTSEGCSSCPPADKWLSQLEQNGFKPAQVVPLAFHVDYWDYIGWKDVFAKAEFSERQRRAARLQNSNTVYTPQFMLNGADFRGWFRGSRLKDQVTKNHHEIATAEIILKLSNPKIEHPRLATTIKLSPIIQGKDHDLYIAIYENGLKTAVKAGENKGRELMHDYVVREWYGPYKLGNQHQPWQQDMAILPKWLGRNAGVAAFVQNRNTGEILQATSLKMCS